tara:strand:+ start:3834 stop:4139 length:306 start_codon:yes stop_codon:yes gene_type:complete
LDFQKCADYDFDVFLMTKSSLSFAKLNIYTCTSFKLRAVSFSFFFSQNKVKESLCCEELACLLGGVKDDVSNIKNVRCDDFPSFFPFFVLLCSCSLDVLGV